jgi:hypothetical protein
VVQKLGTIEHEAALAELSREHSSARSEAIAEWKAIWETYSEQKAIVKSVRTEQGSGLGIDTKAVRASLEGNADFYPELTNSMMGKVDLLEQVDASLNEFTKSLSKAPQYMLLVDLQMFFVFVKYFAARIAFLAMRHSFIIFVAILIFGVTYSRVVAGMTDFMEAYFPEWPWLGAALILGAALVKKYYVDAKLKKVQTRLEAHWLSRFALHLHMVRAYALLSRTKSRQLPNGD